MSEKDLQDIKDYWEKKYPTVSVTFYHMHDDGRYRGKMRTLTESFDLRADTIGELISQGESFLRKVKQ